MPEINQYGQTVNDVVLNWQGARVITHTTLTGHYCRLEPLNAERHVADLFEVYALGNDGDWTWLASSHPKSIEAAKQWLIDKSSDDTLISYAVIDLFTGQAVGMVSYMVIERGNGSVEIGHVIWSRKMKGTRMASEAIWLMLKNAFEHGYRRLEWKCDSMNVASYQAAKRLGFVWEGCLRQKLVRKGRTRDTEIFSIIDSEWPARDAELRAWLAAENFDQQGQQIHRLEALREKMAL